MSMRHVIVVSYFTLGLTLPAAAIAQQNDPPPAALQLLELVAQRQQSAEDAQRAANMARELERLVNRLQEQRATIGGLVLEQGGGGGRGGARQGGPAPQTTFDPRANDPMSGPVVANAPFSADAITVATQTLGDGTNITQRATAKFYRDGTGRIRREQTIVGIDALNPRAPGVPMTVVTLDSEPGDPRPYQLDQAAKTARRVARAAASSPGGVNVGVALTLRQTGGVTFGTGGLDQVDMPINFQGLTIPRRGIPSDLRPTEEQLGTRQIEGLKATGKRTTVTIPTDRVGNDRPIQITDERWESPELGLVVYSRYSDPRTGVVEYRLTSLNRSEPRADLFTVPSDYTIAPEGGGRRGGGPAPLAPDSPPAPGQRGGGGGGRGGRSPQ
jgi:hypothetical protein